MATYSKKNNETLRRTRRWLDSRVNGPAIIAVLGLVVAVAVAGGVWWGTRPSVARAENFIAMGDVAKGVDMLTGLANRGDTDAAARLGAMFYRGDTVAKNHSFALPYLREAADAGNVDAQGMLGEIASTGSDGRPDHALAAQYLLPLDAGGNGQA
ncbi:MAG: hypothetical protein LIQ30_10365, partial [Planctomycetes bacterium]|nr:hypothetical protein [Planctomycetota bacterium]